VPTTSTLLPETTPKVENQIILTEKKNFKKKSYIVPLRIKNNIRIIVSEMLDFNQYFI